MMTTLNLRTAIIALLSSIAENLSHPAGIVSRVVIDAEHDEYLLLFVGWTGERQTQRELMIAAYLRIHDDKIWIEANTGPDDIAAQLVAAGIPRDQIVLGLQPAWKRPLGEYATA